MFPRMTEEDLRTVLRRVRAGESTHPVFVIGTGGDPSAVFDILTEELGGSPVRIVEDPSQEHVSDTERKAFSEDVAYDTDTSRVVVTDDVDRYRRMVSAPALTRSFCVTLAGTKATRP